MCVYVCVCVYVYVCVCVYTPERRKGEREQASERKRAIAAECVLWGEYNVQGGLLLKTLKDSRGILKHKVNKGDLSSGASKSTSNNTCILGLFGPGPRAVVIRQISRLSISKDFVMVCQGVRKCSLEPLFQGPSELMMGESIWLK